MNADRRRRIGMLRTQLEDIRDLVEPLKDEEQEAYDNMPESFQSGNKGEQSQAVIDSLDSASQSVEESRNYIDEAVSA